MVYPETKGSFTARGRLPVCRLCAMSRCFPFPPPGYTKKHRPDDANLLVEEKLKEKKHKKEKKDKDKKERKEKKDREKSEEKRREKKEKRPHEKHKERDKENKSTSEQKKVLVASEHQNGGKPSLIGIQGTYSQQQFLLEFEKRLRNEDGATENGRDEKIVAADKGCISLQGKFTESTEKLKDKSEDNRMVNGHTLKVVAMALGTGVVSSFMGEVPNKAEGGGFVVEKADEKRKEHKEKKKHRETDGKGDKHQDRDQNKHHKSKNKKEKKEKKKKDNEKEEKSKEQIRQCSIDSVDIHANGSSYVVKVSSCSKGNLGKRKEPETNGVLHDSESRSSKKSRPVSLSHQVVQNGSKCDASQNHKVDAEVQLPQSYVRNGQRLYPGHIVHSFISEKSSIVNNHKVQNSLSLMPSCSKLESCQAAMNSTNSRVTCDHSLNKNGSSLQPVVENLQGLDCSQPNIIIAVKREVPFCSPKVDEKDYVVNGRTKTLEPVKNKEVEKRKSHLHPDSEHLGQMLTMEKKVSSSQSVLGNQGKSDCGQQNIHTAVERQGPLCAPKVDNKKYIINGLMKTQESKKKKEKVETQETPPHPDSKYLSQIFTVPEVEWSGSDDHAWLFSSDESKGKKRRTDTNQIDETQQVWAEALGLESADIVALPYVIPY